MRFATSVSLLAVLAAAPLSGASAQNALSVGAESQGTIVVSASRSGTPLEELPISVTVIDQEELAQQLDFSTDVLRAIEQVAPGLSPQGDRRIGCFVGIRGRQTSIQINGIPVNQDLRQSNCNAMYQISPFAIEQIEVVRGGTALFGAGAPGGIVNLITRRAKGPDLEVDAVAQTSFNTSDWDGTFTHNLYLGAGQDLGGWDYYLGAAYTDTGARRTPDGAYVPYRTYESVALNGSLGGDLLGGEIRATGTYYRETPDQEYAMDGTQVVGNRFANVIPIGDHPQIEQARDQLTTLSLSYHHPEVLAQELDVSLFWQDQHYRQRDNFYGATGNSYFASDSENERIGFRSTLVKRFALGRAPATLSYGFDFTSNRFYRPNVDPATGAITGFTSPEITLDTYALFAQAEVALGDVRLVGGLRQEWYRGEVGDEGYAPGIPGAGLPGEIGKSELLLFNLGGVWNVTGDVQLFAGFSQGAELTQLGRAARGITNPALITPEPATSDQFEAGVRAQVGVVKLEFAGFHSRSDSASLLQADPSCAGAGPGLCPLIPLRSPQRFHGVEASADTELAQGLSGRAIVTWQRGRIYNAVLDDYIDYSTDIVAPLRITAGLDWAPIEGLRTSLQGTYHGAADYFTPAELSVGRVATDDYFLVDASVGYQLFGGEVFLAASNLLDEEYVNVQNQGLRFASVYYVAEGRRVTLGFKGRF